MDGGEGREGGGERQGEGERQASTVWEKVIRISCYIKAEFNIFVFISVEIVTLVFFAKKI